MNHLKAFAAALIVLTCLSVHAQDSSEALKRCLSDNTSGKDRKDLARWIFMSIAAHPEIRSLSKVTPLESDATSQVIGKLFTRLIGDDCSKEVSTLVKTDGPQSLRSAFEFLGQLAIQELTANQEVAASLSQFQKYVDQARIAAPLQPK